MGGIPINPVLRGLLTAYSLAERIKQGQRQDAAQRGWEADRARRAANEDTDIEIKMHELGATPVMGGLIEEQIQPPQLGITEDVARGAQTTITRKPRTAQLFKRTTSQGEKKAWELPSTEEQHEKALAIEARKKLLLGRIEKDLTIEEKEALKKIGETPGAIAEINRKARAAADAEKQRIQQNRDTLKRKQQIEDREDTQKFQGAQNKLQRESYPKPSQAQDRLTAKDERSQEIDAAYSEVLNEAGGNREKAKQVLDKLAKEKGGIYKQYRGILQDRIERGEKAPQGYDPFRGAPSPAAESGGISTQPTAVNSETGERIAWDGEKWVPVQ